MRQLRRSRVYGSFVFVLVLRAVVSRHKFCFAPALGPLCGGFVFAFSYLCLCHTATALLI